MDPDKAIAHFGTVLRLANFLEVSPQAVYAWKEAGKIPHPWARLLELETNGKLKSRKRRKEK